MGEKKTKTVTPNTRIRHDKHTEKHIDNIKRIYERKNVVSFDDLQLYHW
jgi:hypothetical protein